MPEERLSEHFWLSEFTDSQIAERLGIDNTPSLQVLANLRINAENMEAVRALLGVPILISSGYRCEELERVLSERDYLAFCRRNQLMPGPPAWKSYFGRKQHPKGLATDFTAPAFGSPAQVCRRIVASEVPFSQLIFEHSWTHIGWPDQGQVARREALTLTQDGYAQGILEGVA